MDHLLENCVWRADPVDGKGVALTFVTFLVDELGEEVGGTPLVILRWTNFVARLSVPDVQCASLQSSTQNSDGLIHRIIGSGMERSSGTAKNVLGSWLGVRRSIAVQHLVSMDPTCLFWVKRPNIENKILASELSPDFIDVRLVVIAESGCIGAEESLES